MIEDESFADDEMKQLFLNDFVPKKEREEAIEACDFLKGSQHRCRKTLFENLFLQDTKATNLPKEKDLKDGLTELSPWKISNLLSNTCKVCHLIQKATMQRKFQNFIGW